MIIGIIRWHYDVVAVVVLVALVSTGNLFAQTKPILVNGDTKIFSNVTPPFIFKAGQRIGSMCCQAVGDNVDVDITSVVASGNGLSGVEQPFEYTGGYYPPIQTVTTSFAAEKSRVCMVNAGNRASFTSNISSSTPGSSIDNLEVRCDDTTLVGGWNTVVTQLNYLEVVNTTGFPVSVRLYGYSEAASGEKVLDVQFNITSNTAGPRRRDIDIHSLVGKGTFGTLVLAHNGPLGSVKADIAQYRITSTNPFDFELVARNPLTLRDR